MFSSFQLSTDGDGDGGNKQQAKQAAQRRISTANACTECRRRKIRCDGLQPCGQCQWYGLPQACTYAKPTQRVLPSRKLVGELSTQNGQLSSLFNRLFPGRDLDQLLSLPRTDLLNLAVSLPDPTVSPPSDLHDSGDRIGVLQQSEGAESLDALDQAPDQDPIVDEARRYGAQIQAISDDVNGLSLSFDQPSSYVGVSSITAALKVIFRAVPVARSLIAQSYMDTTLVSRNNSPPPESLEPDPYFLPPPDIGHKLIESYFFRVHVMMPMIDEDQFWRTYLYAERSDSPWLALLNVVLALGSLARSTSDDDDHIAYYQRARRHLDIETFGSSSLLVLQALGLLGGYYLHWLNRPNEANNLMGATLRMATALGLHREYTDGPQLDTSSAEVPVEIRRRTWWSLFCLDTWAMMSTGRPSLGRNGPGITVKSPQIPEQTNNAQYLASMKLLPIVHNLEFCKLCTKIVDKLAGQSLLKADDLLALDAELISWREDLPPILRDLVVSKESDLMYSPSRLRGRGSSASKSSPVDFSKPPSTTRTITSCPDVLKTPRAIMYWWYLNLRIIMHRPYVLAAALRRKTIADLTADERTAVRKCRLAAGQAIQDIAATCEDNLIAGWNAVWIMYQAVMVPLVSLFSHLSASSQPLPPRNPTSAPRQTPMTIRSSEDPSEVESWGRQIETALAFFQKVRQQKFSVAARKSHDVVQRLYAASQQLASMRPSFEDSRLNAPNDSGIHAHNEIPAPGSDAAGHPAFESPNEAAIASFWDEMMYETFPELPFPALGDEISFPQGGGGGGILGGGMDSFNWQDAMSVMAGQQISHQHQVNAHLNVNQNSGASSNGGGEEEGGWSECRR